MRKEINKKRNNFIYIKNLLNYYARLDNEVLLRKLKSDINVGLHNELIKDNEEDFGKNIIDSEKGNAFFRRLFESFFNPFSIVLMILAFVSFITKDIPATIAIFCMIILSAIIKFIQENKSFKAGEKLKEMIETTTCVIREGIKKEIPIDELVVGDIVILGAGDIIPADIKILKAKDLFLSQSALTGESEAIEKFTKLSQKTLDKDILLPLELENLCFMGTNIISGSGVGIVLVVGNNTYFGQTIKTINRKRPPTSFDKGLNAVSWLLIKFMMVMVLIVFLLNGLVKGNWLEAFLFAISIAVGLTPEMLPMIVTTNLAKGAINMSKRKSIVKNINSIQNFGAMDILCTDKTGTITEDRIVLQYHLNLKGEEDKRVLRYGYLNSYFQTGLKNLLDLAVINKANENEFGYLNDNYVKVDEIPFDFTRRRMSVVLRKNIDGKTQLITKGAVEEMLSISKFVEYNNETVEINDELRQKIIEMVNNLNSKGMRVIAVAKKNNPAVEEVFSVKDENEMTLVGCLSFLDPPKESAKSAIKTLNTYGINVKILTGDNDLVSKYIGKEVGINSDKILLGSDLENISDEKLAEISQDIEIFAKLSPEQKARVVRSLKKSGHVVGFMGDGINDSLAMRESDVSISVDTAVDIAKESADIILLKKDLRVLKEGVKEGRKTFCNIIKYIKMTTSSNFGNMFSILFASAFLPFLPMLPIQILVLNLLYDLAQISIPWDNVDKEYIISQKKWDTRSLKSFILWVGPVSSIFDITTFLIMWFIFKCNDATNLHLVHLFNTAWFVVSMITQNIIIHLIRTEKTPYVNSKASKQVALSTVLSIIVAIILPYTFIGKYISLVPLPINFYKYLIFIVIGYILTIQIIKKPYIKKYKNWI